MKCACAWTELLAVLPLWMRSEVDKYGREALQELRLRLDQPPELVCRGGSTWLQRTVVQEDLSYCVSAASRYSPWTATSAAEGYLTSAGGHRLGLCGEAVLSGGTMQGIRRVTSICVRVARDFPGIAAGLSGKQESILILGRPGSGKTTLLRDLIRQISDSTPQSIAVVDERGELFPPSARGGCFPSGKKTDVLSGCPKAQGIETVLRTMGAGTIAVDEITAAADCQALLHAGWCGVRLLATAHASGVRDLQMRPVYRPILESRLFDTAVVLQADKSWRTERIPL